MGNGSRYPKNKKNHHRAPLRLSKAGIFSLGAPQSRVPQSRVLYRADDYRKVLFRGAARIPH